MSWTRHPRAQSNKADYRLVDDATGRVVGELRWCGHPTALWPYFTYVEDQLVTFITVEEGKSFVEDAVKDPHRVASEVREIFAKKGARR